MLRMGGFMELLKIDVHNEDSFKYYRQFLASDNFDWKKEMTLRLVRENVVPPSQRDLTDDEYCKFLYLLLKEIDYDDEDEYLLVDGNNPVTFIVATNNDDNTVEISYRTAECYRNKGYATKALQILEEKLFNNQKVYSVILRDVSLNKITSKIATSSGYTYDDKTNSFFKSNPNINMEERRVMGK